MYSRGAITFKYLDHYLRSSNGRGHGTHSPFIYRLIRDILRDKNEYPEYSKVENLRRRLSADNSLLQIDDPGAGSAISIRNERTVSSLARHAAKPPRLGKLLFRIARELKPRTILELGTSLGITTSYLALANTDAKVITVEGVKAIADKAEDNFNQLELENVKLLKGNFDDVLPGILKDLPRLDLFFLDGNHRKEPTLDYFKQVLPKMYNESVMIFDDIHWSRGMEEAWEMIKLDDSVRCTVDLFWVGLAFLRREFHEKQHFRIRF